MMQVRRGDERGRGDYGWLDTRYTFSFADYRDPRHSGFRALRVLNDDRIAPGRGFPTHGHRDMEILTWVVDGSLEHRDSMGNGSVIGPGELQRMTAGTGVQHSEFNPSDENPLRLLQIWIEPEERGLTPGYEQRRFAPESRRGRWRLVASRDGRDGSLTLHRNAAVYAALLEDGEELAYDLEEGRHAWLQLVRGDVRAGDRRLGEGDGLAVSGEPGFTVRADGSAELLLFDLD